ncbi:phage tail fiber C-terminal domain-containing protein [Escherichia coli]
MAINRVASSAISQSASQVDREHGELLTAQLRLGPADILESDENGIIPEQDRVITQVVILDADKKQIQCVVRPLQILRADGTWENIGGMK